MSKSIKKLAKPIEEITECDFGYAAGIIDGEGCIGAYPAQHCPTSFRVQVNVTMTSSQAVFFLADTFGGFLRIEKKKTVVNKPLFRWTLYSREAAAFLELIHPYLKIKKDNAIDAINLAKLHRKRGGVGSREKGKIGGWVNVKPSFENVEQRFLLVNRIKERNNYGNKYVQKSD